MGYSRRHGVLVAFMVLTVPRLVYSSGVEEQTTVTTITVGVVRSENPRDQKPFEEREFTRWLEAETGIHIEWVVLPAGSAREQLEGMVETGDLPDVLVTQNLIGSEKVFEYVRSGVFIPIDDAIEQYAPHLRRVSETDAYRWVREQLTMPDGRMYSFPYVLDCLFCQFPLRMWIYKPWVDELGLPWPETTADYLAFLEGVKSGDPNRSGDFDEIPLIGVLRGDWLDPRGFLMNAFVFAQIPYQSLAPFLSVEDGTRVTFVADTEAWREGLRYLRYLVGNQLLDAESFSMDSRREVRAKIRRDNPHVVGSYSGAWYGLFVMDEEGRLVGGENFEAVAPFAGPENERNVVFGQPALWLATHITTAGEDRVEEIAGLIDWWFEEPIEANYLCTNFWQRGVHWRALNDDEKSLGLIGVDGQPASTVWIEDQPVDKPFEGWWRSCFARWQGEGRAVSPESTEWRVIVDSRDLYAPYIHSLAVPDPVASDGGELKEIRDQVVQLVNRASIEFMTGIRDIDDDEDWEKYQKDLESVGLSKYVEGWQRLLNERHS